jgi:hypothetical protein
VDEARRRGLRDGAVGGHEGAQGLVEAGPGVAAAARRQERPELLLHDPPDLRRVGRVEQEAQWPEPLGMDRHGPRRGLGAQELRAGHGLPQPRAEDGAGLADPDRDVPAAALGRGRHRGHDVGARLRRVADGQDDVLPAQVHERRVAPERPAARHPADEREQLLDAARLVGARGPERRDGDHPVRDGEVEPVPARAGLEGRRHGRRGVEQLVEQVPLQLPPDLLGGALLDELEGEDGRAVLHRALLQAGERAGAADVQAPELDVARDGEGQVPGGRGRRRVARPGGPVRVAGHDERRQDVLVQDHLAAEQPRQARADLGQPRAGEGRVRELAVDGRRALEHLVLAPQLLVEARVLHGHRGLRGERAGQRDVRLGERRWGAATPRTAPRRPWGRGAWARTASSRRPRRARRRAPRAAWAAPRPGSPAARRAGGTRRRRRPRRRRAPGASP